VQLTSNANKLSKKSVKNYEQNKLSKKRVKKLNRIGFLKKERKGRIEYADCFLKSLTLKRDHFSTLSKFNNESDKIQALSIC